MYPCRTDVTLPRVPNHTHTHTYSPMHIHAAIQSPEPPFRNADTNNCAVSCVSRANVALGQVSDKLNKVLVEAFDNFTLGDECGDKCIDQTIAYSQVSSAYCSG